MVAEVKDRKKKVKYSVSIEIERNRKEIDKKILYSFTKNKLSAFQKTYVTFGGSGGILFTIVT